MPSCFLTAINTRSYVRYKKLRHQTTYIRKTPTQKIATQILELCSGRNQSLVVHKIPTLLQCRVHFRSLVCRQHVKQGANSLPVVLDILVKYTHARLHPYGFLCSATLLFVRAFVRDTRYYYYATCTLFLNGPCSTFFIMVVQYPTCGSFTFVKNNSMPVYVSILEHVLGRHMSKTVVNVDQQCPLSHSQL